MSLSNFPAIGDIVLDPSEKFKDENQEGKYDLLLCDGSEVDAIKYPVLAEGLPTGGYVASGLTEPLIGETTPLGLTRRSGLLWVIGAGNTVVEYDFGGSVTGESVSTTQAGPSTGIVWLNDILYVMAFAGGAVHAFEYTGTYLGVVGTVQTGSRGLDFDGEFFWVCNATTGLYKYDANFNLISNVPLSPSLTAVKASTYHNGSIWICNDSAPYAIHEYGLDGVATGVEFDIPESPLPLGLTFLNLKAYVASNGNDEVVEYLPPLKSTPNIAPLDPAVPYKVVADLYTPKIGDIRSSSYDKYQENGTVMFDQLLCDGSEIDKATHPILYNTLLNITPISLASYATHLIAKTATGYLVGGQKFTNSWIFDGTIKPIQSYATCSDGSGNILTVELGALNRRTETGTLIEKILTPPISIGGIVLKKGSSTEAWALNPDGGTGYDQYQLVDINLTTNTWNIIRVIGEVGEVYHSLDYTPEGNLITCDQNNPRTKEITITGALVTHNIVPAIMYNILSTPNGYVYSNTTHAYGYKSILPDHTPLDPNYPKRIVADKGE